MIYGFDCADEAAAVAALCVYVCWRSRDLRRYRVTPDVWSQVERFAKSAAKRAGSIPEFLERLKPRLMVGTLSPRWMAVGLKGAIPMVETADGLRIQVSAPEEQREFLTAVLERADHKAVLDRLSRETAWVILLVRDRLERERAVEGRFAAAFAADDAMEGEVVA